MTKLPGIPWSAKNQAKEVQFRKLFLSIKNTGGAGLRLIKDRDSDEQIAAALTNVGKDYWNNDTIAVSWSFNTCYIHGQDIALPLSVSGVSYQIYKAALIPTQTLLAKYPDSAAVAIYRYGLVAVIGGMSPGSPLPEDGSAQPPSPDFHKKWWYLGQGGDVPVHIGTDFRLGIFGITIGGQADLLDTVFLKQVLPTSTLHWSGFTESASKIALAEYDHSVLPALESLWVYSFDELFATFTLHTIQEDRPMATFSQDWEYTLEAIGERRTVTGEFILTLYGVAQYTKSTTLNSSPEKLVAIRSQGETFSAIRLKPNALTVEESRTYGYTAYDTEHGVAPDYYQKFLSSVDQLNTTDKKVDIQLVSFSTGAVTLVSTLASGVTISSGTISYAATKAFATFVNPGSGTSTDNKIELVYFNGNHSAVIYRLVEDIFNFTQGSNPSTGPSYTQTRTGKVKVADNGDPAGVLHDLPTLTENFTGTYELGGLNNDPPSILTGTDGPFEFFGNSPLYLPEYELGGSTRESHWADLKTKSLPDQTPPFETTAIVAISGPTLLGGTVYPENSFSITYNPGKLTLLSYDFESPRKDYNPFGAPSVISVMHRGR